MNADARLSGAALAINQPSGRPGPADFGLGTWPRRRARISPDAVALSQGERRTTYAELAASVEAIGAGLSALGVIHGDRVAYLGLNDIVTFEAMFAAQVRGAIFVPINHRLAPAEIGYMLADSGAEVLVVGPGVDAVIDRLPGHCPGVRVVIDARGADAVDLLAELAGRSLPLVEVRDMAAPEVGDVGVGLEDPALFLYTSGTTGRPKAAVITHANLTWNTVNQLAHLDVLSTDRALCISPLFHAVGLGQVTLPVLFKGGTVEVVARFDAGEILRVIEGSGVASFSCVPTMLQMMALHPDWETTDLSSLRQVVYGGSPVDAKVAAAWWRRGVPLQQGYGMTEAAPGVAMAPTVGALEHPVSVGVPHFFTDVAFLEATSVGHGDGHGDGHGEGHGDADQGATRELEPGTRGELLVRGPHVFAGYWNRPAETHAAHVGDWYRTGDVLEVEPDGWLDVVDRVKDLIISGGENVYPAEVEAVIVEIESVRGAAVVGRRDERWGEVGVAFVETAGQDLTAETILAHVRSRLAKFKVPTEIIVVETLPRNATGKLLRHQLRDAVGHPNPGGTP